VTGERVVRRLAAILAADVAGYSRLMGRDEQGTLTRLKSHRADRLEPVLARHGGRLVKLTGDGALVEFSSAVDALSAAIEFQQAMADANRDQPEDTRIVFRIWGAPRIHGELLKLGFDVAQSTVAKYMVRRREPPSQGWKTFLRNHAPNTAAMDLFVVQTVGFKLLYGIVIMRLGRRRLMWVNVTANPTAEWIAQQITEAFPWDQAPHHLLRDRDGFYGAAVIRRLQAMGIRDHPIAPRSPWQNGHVERLIGSIRRDCLDHVIVFGEAHLRRTLAEYATYYNKLRTHRSLTKDAPLHRAIERLGAITSQPTHVRFAPERGSSRVGASDVAT
jgi:transposase InsO family protein